MVIVDSSGAPMKYDMVRVMQDVCAKQWSRLKIDVPGQRGKGWRPTNSFVDTQEDAVLDESWREDMDTGCRYMLEECLSLSSLITI